MDTFYLHVMAYLHYLTRIRTPTQISNPMATYYYAEIYHIGSNPDSDPFPIVYICIVQESQVRVRVRVRQCKYAIFLVTIYIITVMG